MVKHLNDEEQRLVLYCLIILLASKKEMYERYILCHLLTQIKPFILMRSRSKTLRYSLLVMNDRRLIRCMEFWIRALQRWDLG